MISFAVHFLRHSDHGEGAGGNADFTTLTPFGIDHDITNNFSHMTEVELLTVSHQRN